MDLLAYDPNAMSPGLLGFFVVAVLGLATFLLVRSMNKHIRRIDFKERPQGPRRPSGRRPGPSGGTPSGGGASSGDGTPHGDGASEVSEGTRRR